MLEDSIKHGSNSFTVVVFINTAKIFHITMWNGTDGEGSFGIYNETTIWTSVPKITYWSIINKYI